GLSRLIISTSPRRVMSCDVSIPDWLRSNILTAPPPRNTKRRRLVSSSGPLLSFTPDGEVERRVPVSVAGSHSARYPSPLARFPITHPRFVDGSKAAVRRPPALGASPFCDQS